MRIMVDTNVLVSAILFPKSIPAQALVKVLAGDRMVICSYVIEELHEVFERKFKNISKATLDLFLMKLSFEMVFVPSIITPEEYPSIRDAADLPVLVSAITEEVDMLITGDKDFCNLGIEKPKIVTPAQYLSME